MIWRQKPSRCHCLYSTQIVEDKNGVFGTEIPGRVLRHSKVLLTECFLRNSSESVGLPVSDFLSLEAAWLS